MDGQEALVFEALAQEFYDVQWRSENETDFEFCQRLSSKAGGLPPLGSALKSWTIDSQEIMQERGFEAFDYYFHSSEVSVPTYPGHVRLTVNKLFCKHVAVLLARQLFAKTDTNGYTGYIGNSVHQGLGENWKTEELVSQVQVVSKATAIRLRTHRTVLDTLGTLTRMTTFSIDLADSTPSQFILYWAAPLPNPLRINVSWPMDLMSDDTPYEEEVLFSEKGQLPRPIEPDDVAGELQRLTF